MTKKIIIALALLFLTGCAPNLYRQGRQQTDQGEYDRAINTFYEEIRVHPDNYEAWRELGVAFYKKGELDQAEEAFKQANSIKPDARTNLFMGMLYEKQENYDKAIDAYRMSLSYQPEKQTKNMILAHLDQLLTKKIQVEVSKAIEDEDKIDVASIPQNTIAVVDFNSEHLAPELAPISKGLAEFTSLDLAKVQSLKVIDRLKIDVIRDELKLSETEYTDPKYSPRVGRLLGSHKIVTGSVLGIGDDRIRLDGALVNTGDSSATVTDPTEGDVNNFFKVQKDFVFKVIDSLDITLTQAERDAIEQVPTESYLAFLAYCRGLDYKSRGMYREANDAFQQAAGEDAGFQDAQTQLETVAFAPTVTLEQSGALQDFESNVTPESDKLYSDGGFDTFQTNTLLNSGFIQNPGIFDRFGNSPLLPPQTDTRVSIIIIGDLDVQY
ncbi:MAG: tetratricopeptide repeat protein [Candidatus Zixiibacteriota bacterium]